MKKSVLNKAFSSLTPAVKASIDELKGEFIIGLSTTRRADELCAFRMALGGSRGEGSGAVATCLVDINPRCGE